MFSNFIFILPFEFPYCFASSIYLQLENINNAPSKPSNPDIKLTYAQLSLQVLLFTFKAMFLHNLPIIPYCSHIQCMYNQLSWVSVPLHFLPPVWEALSHLFTWWSIYFRWFRLHLGCLYLKVPFPHLLAIRLWQMPLLFTTTAQCGLCTVNQFITLHK